MITFFKILNFCILVLSFSLVPIAYGQDGSAEPEIGAQSVGKKRSKKKRRKKKLPSQEQLADSVTEHVKSWLFPDWQTPDFDWYLSPVVGLKFVNESDESGRTQTLQSEFGLGLGLQGVPLVPGNPGLYLSPSIGHAWGRVDGEYENRAKQKTDIEYTYQRTWADIDTEIYFKFYRHVLSLSGGRKLFSQDGPEDLYNYAVTNDFGVLVLSWLSQHYTHRYMQVFTEKFSDDPFYKEHDNWVHTRLFTSFLNFYLDVGPGLTFVEEKINQGESEQELTVLGQVQYLKLKTAIKPFWKLLASAKAKYVYQSDEELIGEYGRTKLPSEGLYDTPSVVMPEDSLTVQSFAGVADLFMGFGVGYYYNVQILNISEKNDQEDKIVRDSGFGISYTASF